MKNPFFCLSTMLIGINLMDTFLLANHHKVIKVYSDPTSGKQKISIRWFTGILSHQTYQTGKAAGNNASTFSARKVESSKYDSYLQCFRAFEGGISDLSPEFSSLSEKPVICALKLQIGKPINWWNMISPKIHRVIQGAKSKNEISVLRRVSEEMLALLY